MDKEKLLKDLRESFKNNSTKARNDFNRIEQDLKGEDLKTYVKLRKSIFEDKTIYEHYKTYNLALLDLIFDKDVDKYNKLSLEDKKECFEFEKAKDYHVELPYLMEGYYQVIKDYVLENTESPEIVKGVNRIINKGVEELNEEFSN